MAIARDTAAKLPETRSIELGYPADVARVGGSRPAHGGVSPAVHPAAPASPTGGPQRGNAIGSPRTVVKSRAFAADRAVREYVGANPVKAAVMAAGVGATLMQLALIAFGRRSGNGRKT